MTADREQTRRDAPKIADDGTCAQCHGERKMPASKLHRASAALDPFCSAECARAWWGVELPSARFTTSRNLPARDQR